MVSATTLTGRAPTATEEGPVDVQVATAYGAGLGADAYTYLADSQPGDELAIECPHR